MEYLTICVYNYKYSILEGMFKEDNHEREIME